MPEVADVRVQNTSEIEGGDVQGGHVTVGVARDSGPGAVASGDVPGGEF